MRKTCILLLAVTVVLIVCGASSCVIHFSGCGCQTNARFERSVRLETDMGDGLTFAAQTSHSHIHVQGIDENRCYVNATIRVQAKTEEKAKAIAEMVSVELQPSADRMTAVVHKPEVVEKYHVFVSYDVEVPHKTSVDLRTSHDPIECHNLEGNVTAVTSHDPIRCGNITGNLILNTSHDPIECSDIVGDLNVRTSHDPIRLNRITGRIEAHTSHDPIEAEDIVGPMTLRTTHGRITCREIDSNPLNISTTHDNVSVSFKDSVDPQINTIVTTSHGNIDFDVPKDFSGFASLATSHGKINSDIPITVTGNISEKIMNGTIGSGGSGKINLKTSFGSIRLK